MRPEAYTVSYDRTNFNPELIRSNLLGYLGEYRLGVKYAEFYYQIETNFLTKDGLGPVIDRYRNAIPAREERGLSARREVAECLGFQKLEQALVDAPTGTLFIWVSPPGPQEDGYGLYSFTFIGQVTRDPINNEEKIRVIPYRNILTKEEHRTYLRYFTRDAENFKSDTDFLANPVVFSQTAQTRTPEDILSLIGEQEGFNVDWFRRLAEQISPLIQGYLSLVREGARDEELLRTHWAIENYTLSIKERILNEGPVSRVNLKQTVPYIFENWGQQAPPVVAGSCGSTGSTLMEYHSQNKWEYHPGNCLNCGAKGVEVGPCNICKRCEKKFDNDSMGV